MKAGLLLLCVLPLAAHGGVLTVDYEGTVYWADPGAAYEIGDTISGTLLVDTLLMGPDLDLLDPNAGVYGAAHGNLPSMDFVTGFATGLPVHDSIHVLRDLESPNGSWDTYQIVDASAFGTPSFEHLVLHASLPGGTFDDDGGVQIFEAVSQGLGELVGVLSVGWEGTRRQVDFYLSRLSVKPGRCVA